MSKDREIQNRELVSNLRTVLERRGMTQRDFAVLIGKKEAEVSRWFSGKVGISRMNLSRIEEALGEPVRSGSSFHKDNAEIRIGIIGTGDMAGRFVREAVYVKGVRVVAAYNPSLKAETEFCDSFGLQGRPGSADELFGMVDAIYVASPVETHYDYSKAALERGVHVLCEMPFTMTRKEADDLLRTAARKGLVMMAALKTAYCPSFCQMISVARSGIIGEVVDISATVTNLLPDNATVSFANERMMENFTYPLLTIFKLFGLDCRRISSFVKKEGEKMLFTHTSLEYGSSMGSFKVGVGVKSEGSLVVSGTKGYIYIPAPWWKPDYFEVRFENPADNKKYFFPYESSGLRYEIKALADSICRHQVSGAISREEILKMAEIQNRIISKNLQ